MNLFMRVMSVGGPREINMIEALGSLLIGRIDGALRLGTAAHLVSGVFFGIIYALLLMAIRPGGPVSSLFICLGIGFFHGLIFTYMMMYYAAERHPVPKYRNATMSVGIVHLLGHMVYGAVVGFIVGLSPNLVTGISPLLPAQ